MTVAHVFFENQRVREIIKFYRDNSSTYDVRALNQARLASEDFKQLTSTQPNNLGENCQFNILAPLREFERDVNFFTKCGYYSLEITIGLTEADELILSNVIRVLPRR